MFTRTMKPRQQFVNTDALVFPYLNLGMRIEWLRTNRAAWAAAAGRNG
jgi:hypothetical protein